MTGIVIQPPSACSGEELADFAALLGFRKEVNPENLEYRLMKALLLGLFYEDGLLVGISALKKPTRRYMEALEQLLGKPLPLRREAGWAYTRPEARGRGISGALLAGILEYCRQPGMFAVTRVDNGAAGAVLREHGFQPYGPVVPWKGFDSRVFLLD